MQNYFALHKNIRLSILTVLNMEYFHHAVKCLSYDKSQLNHFLFHIVHYFL